MEQRRTPRVPVRIPVTLDTLGTFLDSEIMNLSKGGIFLRADITLAPGAEVDLEFSLPRSARRVRATGTVVWARRRGERRPSAFPGHPCGMGIQFKAMELTDIEAILDEIEQLMLSP